MNEEIRVFKLDSSVNTVFILFRNHYGFDVAENIYLLVNLDVDKSYHTVVIADYLEQLLNCLLGKIHSRWRNIVTFPLYLISFLQVKVAEMYVM